MIACYILVFCPGWLVFKCIGIAYTSLKFLMKVVIQSPGDVTDRICTAGEIQLYFRSFIGSKLKRSSYLKPNKNCNLNSWASGCEPGWGCSVGQKVDLKFMDVPPRTRDCQPCCSGFFCPGGLTCMIRKCVITPVLLLLGEMCPIIWSR